MPSSHIRKATVVFSCGCQPPNDRPMQPQCHRPRAYISCVNRFSLVRNRDARLKTGLVTMFQLLSFPSHFIFAVMRTFALLTALWAFADAARHTSTLTPPVLPLIVRNPYLSTWLGDARHEPWKKWPMFYTGEEVRAIATLGRQLPWKEADWSRLDSEFLLVYLTRVPSILS